jgi:toxin ParE1/3/4
MGEASGRLAWSPEAEADLIAIWRWGAKEWSEELADRHLFDIERACERALRHPLLSKARDDLAAGVRCVPVRPHIIFYRTSKGRLEVVRVLHERMDAARVFAA